ncbi:MAG: helical backbone metal receptor [Acidimicrobiia bacterium]
MMRVVSLVPSATETLLAWGITPVGVTRFCEQPEYQSVGGTKNPDLATIGALRPDLVVMNTEENRREDADALRSAGLRVHAIDITVIEDVAPELQRLAEAVGIPFRPTPDPSLTPRAQLPVFVPIWRRPWMTIAPNTYGASLLSRLGWQAIAPASSDRYPEVTLEYVRAQHPVAILVPSEPYAFRAEHLRELAAIAPVQRIDGKDLFWWGVRTPSALRRLDAAIHTLRR